MARRNPEETVLLPELATVQRDAHTLELFARNALSDATTAVVDTPEAMQLAIEAIGEVTARIRTVKERQDFFTKPLKQHVKVIDQFFRGILTPLQQANDLWRRKVALYRTRVQREQEELSGILATDPSPHTFPLPAVPMIEQQRTMRTESGQSVSASRVWDFEIQDITQIPEGLLRDVVNTLRGREALEQVIRGRVRGGVRFIPGVRVFETERLSVGP